MKSWRSNGILPQETQERIRALLLDAEVSIDLLDQEIVPVLRRLTELKQRRKKEKARAETFRIAISPVKKIPPEILGKIFEAGCTDPVPLPSPKRNRHPWNVSQVCSHWRQITQHLPYLWTIIKISSASQLETKLIARNHFIRETFIRLSSYTAMPMSLFVGGQEVTMMSDLILQHNLRFKKLSFRLTDVECLIAITHLLSHSFSHLQDLEIRNAFPVASSFCDPNSILLFDAPVLRKATISETLYQQMLMIPFAQLTSFRGTNIPLHKVTVYTILREGTSLVDLSFTTVDYEAQFRHTDTISMQHLRSLQITSLNALDWEIFFEPLKCPALSMLSLTVPAYKHDYFSLHALASFISRSGCSITTLQISGNPRKYDVELSDSDFRSLFQLLPSLCKFESSFITPPVVFELLRDGLLPALTKCEWRVLPDGIDAALDFFDTFIPAARSGALMRPLDMQLECTEKKNRIDPIYLRFCNNIPEYALLAPMYLMLDLYDNVVLEPSHHLL